MIGIILICCFYNRKFYKSVFSLNTMKSLINKLGKIANISLFTVASILQIGCRPTPYGRSVADGLLIHAAREGISRNVNPYDREGSTTGNQLQIVNLPNGERGWINYQGFVIVNLGGNGFRTYTLGGERLTNVKWVLTTDNLYEYEVRFNR